MTAQIPDSVSLTHAGEHDSWTLAEAHGHGLYTPERYGRLLPTHHSTDCWRGFVADYRVERDRLWLLVHPHSLETVLEAWRAGDVSAFQGPNANRLQLHWNDDGTPRIEKPPEPSVPANPPEVEHLASGHPAVLIRFSGKLALGRDFIEELYRHGGFPEPWKFRRALVLSLDDGRVEEVSEVTEEMRLIREAHLRLAKALREGASAAPADAGVRDTTAAVHDALRRLQRIYALEHDLDGGVEAAPSDHGVN